MEIRRANSVRNRINRELENSEGGWRRMLCMVRDGWLLYYGSGTEFVTGNDSFHPEGVIQLKQSTVTIVPGTHASRTHCFSVKTPDGSEVMFSAHDPETLRQWVSAIHMASHVSSDSILALESKIARETERIAKRHQRHLDWETTVQQKKEMLVEERDSLLREIHILRLRLQSSGVKKR
eukprot:c11181_g1_i1.p2 GENE.c11181_g1_i1~~c11181_g1_i1.p2  ORF type:complete len:179 (-),score=33.50 c11181_g1_i1:100-636(-)